MSGLGADDFIAAHQAYGFEFERHVARFEAALQILLPMLRGENAVTLENFTLLMARRCCRGRRPARRPS